jgi:hypothetical protein
MNNLTMINVP